MKADQPLTDEQKRILTDRNAAWREHLAFPKQLALLDKLHIPHAPDITAGESADLINKAIADHQKRRQSHAHG